MEAWTGHHRSHSPSPRVSSNRSGVPTSRASTSPGLVRNRAAQQKVSRKRVREASSVAPHHSHYRLSLPPPTPIPSLWKDCLSWDWSLVPKKLGTTAIDHQVPTVQRSENSSIKSQMANILGCAGYTVNATQLLKKKKKTTQLWLCGKHNLM